MRRIVCMVLCACAVFAQTPSTKPVPNVAVIPFVGDANVTPAQLNFLSQRFASDLLSTKAFNLLDRSKMEFILKEQGFQQSGACNTSECQVQMGQLLGVDNIISGNLVQFGSKYAFHVDYIDVGSGQVVHTAEVSGSGKLEDVYESLCQGAAIKLAQKVRGEESTPLATPSSSAPLGIQDNSAKVPADALPKADLKPMSTKRKIALALWGSGLLSTGGAYYFNAKGLDYQQDFDDANTSHNASGLRTASSNLDDAALYRNVSLGTSVGTALVGLVLWFFPEGQ